MLRPPRQARTSTRSPRRSSATASTATSAATACSRWRPGRTRSPASSPTSRASSTPTAVPGAGRLADVPRRPGRRRRAARWSTRPGWPGGWRPRPRRWACGSPSTPASSRLDARGRPGVVRPPRRDRRRPTASRSATNAFPAAAGAGCGSTPCRSTTTCWPPSRSPTSSSPRSAGTSRQGIADSGNQFHYYRLTADDRILWGGYDAIYHFGRRIDPALDDRRATYRLLAEQLLRDVPAARRAPVHATAGAA